MEDNKLSAIVKLRMYEKKLEGSSTGYLRNVIGPTPQIPIQPRNGPCGCGSGAKAKKCCGKYPNLNKEN